MKSRIRALERLLLVLLAVLAAVSLLQAQTLTVTSPPNGAVVPSGQTLTVTVAASGANFQDVWLGGNLDVIFQQVPGTQFQFAAVIPATTPSGTYWLTAGGHVQNALVNDASISIDVERPGCSRRHSERLTYIGSGIRRG